MDERDGPELDDETGDEREERPTVVGGDGTVDEQALRNGNRASRERQATGAAGETAPHPTDPTISDETATQVVRTLERGPHVDGPETGQFETALANTQDVANAVAVDSGTAALFVALRAAGVDPGDEVFVPAYGPFTTVSVVLTLGATPVFVDANPATYTMGVFTLQRAIETATDPAAIVPAHVHGQPAELNQLASLASEHDLTLVEDARDALGASYQGEPVGTVGDVGCFSFGPGRPLSVGGNGGMVVTDDDDLATEMRVFRDKGRDRNGVRCRTGLNHQLEEVLAIVGQEQLERLPARTERRREIAMQYRQRLASLPQVRLPTTRRDADHAFASFVVHVADPAALAVALDERGIPTGQPHPVPSDRHPAVRAQIERLPDVRYADRLCDRLLALPLDATMSDDEVVHVCTAIEEQFV